MGLNLDPETAAAAAEVRKDKRIVMQRGISALHAVQIENPVWRAGKAAAQRERVARQPDLVKAQAKASYDRVMADMRHWCEPCQTAFPKPSKLAAHLSSKRHISQVAAIRKSKPLDFSKTPSA